MSKGHHVSALTTGDLWFTNIITSDLSIREKKDKSSVVVSSQDRDHSTTTKTPGHTGGEDRSPLVGCAKRHDVMNFPILKFPLMACLWIK